MQCVPNRIACLLKVYKILLQPTINMLIINSFQFFYLPSETTLVFPQQLLRLLLWWISDNCSNCFINNFQQQCLCYYCIPSIDVYDSITFLVHLTSISFLQKLSILFLHKWCPILVTIFYSLYYPKPSKKKTLHHSQKTLNNRHRYTTPSSSLLRVAVTLKSI